MAGLGRRTFAAGEVLTASNVMGYLQDQAVMTFAGTAARGSAIGTATEGMVSYLADTNLIQVYDGSAWQQVYPASVAAGQVIQVVQDTKLDAFSTTSTAYTDITDFSVSITPSSASNKVLIICSFTSTTVNQESWFRLAGGNAGTYIGDASSSRERAVTNFGVVANSNRQQSQTVVYLDSPATTSAITYKLQTRTISGGTLYIGRGNADTDNANFGRTPASIVAMEVKG